jgi:threonine/homoserine/homoserine lactone efflux protein
MDSSAVLAYISLTFFLVITPGATTAVVIRNTLERGFRGGVSTAAGAAIANTTHATAACLGLTLVLQRFPAVLLAVRTAGALYLAWLGVVSLTHAWRGEGSLVRRIDTGRTSASQSGVRDGLVVNLLNPPILTFYLMLPTFLPPHPAVWMFATLAAVHVTMAFVCHVAWALVFERLRHALTRRGALRFLDAGTGVALLLLALRTLL